MRRIWDVSVPIHEGMPSWPTNPPVKITPVKEIDAGGRSNVTEMELSTHTGTHVDAPHHFITGATTVDRLDLSVLCGPCVVVEDLEADVLDGPAVARLLTAATVDASTRVLFKTRSSALWASDGFREDYVSLDESGARELVSRGVELVGVDYLSIERFGGTGEVHRILLAAGVVGLEGLDLRDVGADAYELLCLPLKIAGADGAPARVVLREL